MPLFKTLNFSDIFLSENQIELGDLLYLFNICVRIYGIIEQPFDRSHKTKRFFSSSILTFGICLNN